MILENGGKWGTHNVYVIKAIKDVLGVEFDLE